MSEISYLTFFDPSVILRVITAPNSAFAQIRDDEHRHFVPSVGVFLLASVMSAFIILPFVMIPIDNVYDEDGVLVDDIPTVFMSVPRPSQSGFEENGVDDDPEDSIIILIFVASGIITGIVSTVLFYFIGKKLGGNASWKKVFSVLFYAHAPLIPISVALSISTFLMLGSYATFDPLYLMAPDSDAVEDFSVVEFLAYTVLFIATLIIFVVWIFIISVKAIKTVNGFGTAKAFGLVVLVITITALITMPLEIVL